MGCKTEKKQAEVDAEEPSCLVVHRLPESFRQRQEEVRLLEADMCVKEVEGAPGQESAHRQEKACGGDGGGWRWRVPGLLSDGCFSHTHTHTHRQACSQGFQTLLVPTVRPAEKERESRCQSMHAEEAGSNTTSMVSRAALHCTALHCTQLCPLSTAVGKGTFFFCFGVDFHFAEVLNQVETRLLPDLLFFRASGAVLSLNSGSPGTPEPTPAIVRPYRQIIAHNHTWSADNL